MILTPQPSRYAFYAPSEDGEVTWYISPPVTELNAYDKDFIKNIVDSATEYFETEFETVTQNLQGTIKHAHILAHLTSEIEHFEGEDVFDVNEKDASIFSDLVTLQEGYARLTKKWLVFDSSQRSINKKLKKLSQANQLLVSQINNWV